MWVVKLGGSLQYSPHLPAWLEEIATHGGGKVIIVPGGGAFADQVRQAQQYWHFNEQAAHQMALLAMEQYGLMMKGIENRLRTARTTGEIATVLAAGEVAVWLPSGIACDREIQPGWDVTSDSLSAWLARKMEARHLLLVKSVVLESGHHPVSDLIHRGLLDTAFNRMVDGMECEITWLSSEQHTCLAAELNECNSFQVRLHGDSDLVTG